MYFSFSGSVPATRWLSMALAATLMCGVSSASAQQTGTIGDQTPAQQVPQGEELNQKASYIIGRQIFGDFNNDGVSIDVEALIQGIRDEAAAKESPIAAEEVPVIMKAFGELVQQQRQEKLRMAADNNLKEAQQFLSENELKPGIKKLENGIQYQVQKEGTGPSPEPTDTVTVHYTGMFLDGTKFDSSVDRGEPATFPLDQVIRGWTETVPRMKVGSKWKLFIPPGLAYGERGNQRIPPNKLLVFEIELLGIEGK